MEVKILDNNYSVTDIGDVYSLNFMRTGKKKKLSKYTRNGIHTVQIKGVKHAVKTLVAKAFVKNPNEKEYDCVIVIDGDQNNLKPSNLKWGNRLMSAENSINKKRTVMTKEIADEIRRDYKTFSQSEIAKYFDVSINCVRRILNNKSWV